MIGVPKTRKEAVDLAASIKRGISRKLELCNDTQGISDKDIIWATNETMNNRYLETYSEKCIYFRALIEALRWGNKINR